MPKKIQKEIHKNKLLISKTKANSERRIHFSFKHFDYSNINEKLFNDYPAAWKHFFAKLKSLHNKPLVEIISSRLIVLEKDPKTIDLAKRIVKDNIFFNLCSGNVYDLFRGGLSLRVFGLLEGNSGCFRILMIDPTHEIQERDKSKIIS